MRFWILILMALLVLAPSAWPQRQEIRKGGGSGGTATATNAVNSINGLDGAAQPDQSFATGTSGSDFNIVSGGSTHTFHIPNAAAGIRGLLIGSDWVTFNNKASTNSPLLHGPTLLGPTIADFSSATHDHQDGAGGGQLNASSVFSGGTIPPARLGSGTADGTTFLRGDNVWAVPPGEGGTPAGENLMLQINYGGEFGAATNLLVDPLAGQTVITNNAAGDGFLNVWVRQTNWNTIHMRENIEFGVGGKIILLNNGFIWEANQVRGRDFYGEDFQATNGYIGMNLTANAAVYADANQRLVSADGVSPTELGYLDGLTDPIQQQLDLLAPLDSPTLSTPTLQVPVIADFTSATHDHQDGAGGGLLNASSVFDSGTVEVVYGGTGASTASGARTALGVAIGSDVQAHDADLDALAAISGVQGDVLYHNGTSWVKLGPGTPGHFFQTQGAGSNPQWAAESGGGSQTPWAQPIDADGFGVSELGDIGLNPTSTMVQNWVAVTNDGTVNFLQGELQQTNITSNFEFTVSGVASNELRKVLQVTQGPDGGALVIFNDNTLPVDTNANATVFLAFDIANGVTNVDYSSVYVDALAAPGYHANGQMPYTTNVVNGAIGWMPMANLQPRDGDLDALAAISGVQGDVLYHNGTSWVKLGPGTPGHFFQTQGAGANPQWAAQSGGGGSQTPITQDVNYDQFAATNLSSLIVNDDENGTNAFMVYDSSGALKMWYQDTGGLLMKSSGGDIYQYRPGILHASSDNPWSITVGGQSRWFFAHSAGSHALYPGVDDAYDIGLDAQRVRTLKVHDIITGGIVGTNATIYDTFRVVGAAAITADEAGEIGFDTDAIGGLRGGFIYNDGTGNQVIVGVSAADTPVPGEALVYNASGFHEYASVGSSPPLYSTNVTAVTTNFTVNADVATGNDTTYDIDLTANSGLIFAGTPSHRQKITLAIAQDGTGNRTLALPSNVNFGQQVTGLTLSTNANVTDFAIFQWDNDQSHWNIFGAVNRYPD